MPIYDKQAFHQALANQMSSTRLGAAALATLPFFGGTRKAQATRGHTGTTGLVYQRRRRTPVRASFKKKVMQIQNAKHYTYTPTQAMTHATLYTTCPTAGITQGDAIGNRDGDSIYLVALKVKGMFLAPTDKNAYSMRIIVGWTGEEVGTLGSTFGSGVGSSQLFHPSTTGSWFLNGIINPKAFTALYDQTVDINSLIDTVREVSSFNFTVPLEQSFSYQSTASTDGKTKTLVIIVCSAVSGGSSGTTASGDSPIAIDLIFKG